MASPRPWLSAAGCRESSPGSDPRQLHMIAADPEEGVQPVGLPAAEEALEPPPVAAARADERRRLARDFHDGAQQVLLAIAVELGLAAEEAAADPRLQRRLLALRGHVDEALDQLVGIVGGELPSLLAEFGLEPALAAVVARMPAPVGLGCRALRRYGD